jgi:hypothetical protein
MLTVPVYFYNFGNKKDMNQRRLTLFKYYIPARYKVNFENCFTKKAEEELFQTGGGIIWW